MSYTNIYRFGQCTWGAANLANWVLEFGNLGNALDWAANWREHGGFVGMTPAVGTVVCFQPYVDGADAVFGHVAGVIAVTGDQFTVDETNGPKGPGHYDDRICGDSPGCSYLYPYDPTPPHPPAPPPTGGPQMWLYQLTNGTIYLVQGGVKLQLGSGADAEVYIADGVKLYRQGQFTAAYQATLEKLPVVAP